MERATLKQRESAQFGRLEARPHCHRGTSPSGLRKLMLQAHRDGALYVPPQLDQSSPAPFVLMLHGAGGDAEQGVNLLRNFADELGFILLVPESRQGTWDIILGRYGPDVVFIDKALEEVFNGHEIDPRRFAIAGFSDGASYALSLGITNSDLFTHILAYSPGFLAPARQIGFPAIYISHGIHDSVLPVARCSRSIVLQLKNAGAEPVYREFAGPHTVPEAIRRESLHWFIKGVMP